MSSHQYQPIAQDSYEGEVKEEDSIEAPKHGVEPTEDPEAIGAASNPPSFWDRIPTLANWQLIFILLTILNLTVTLSLLFWRPNPIAQVSPRQRNLSNQFYGLSSTMEQGAPWLSNTTIITFPTLLQQIDSSNPDRVYPDDPRRYHSTFGTLSPEDRPLLVSSSITTIAQFKTRDYGMENCTLKIILPSDRSFSPFNQTVSVGRQRDWALFTEPMEIQIWSVDISDNEDVWIDPRTLSYKTHPRKKDLFSSLLIKPSSEAQTHSFPCKSNEVLSFLVSCEDCLLDVWQDKQHPPMGLLIEQLPSVL